MTIIPSFRRLPRVLSAILSGEDLAKTEALATGEAVSRRRVRRPYLLDVGRWMFDVGCLLHSVPRRPSSVVRRPSPIVRFIGRSMMAMVCLTALLGHLPGATGKDNVMNRISLPEPRTKGTISVEETIQHRRSERNFDNKSLTKEQLSQLAWCAQGITDAKGHKRAAPSAGATYPLDLYVVVGEKTCGDISAGVYRYLPEDHAFKIHLAGDRRQALAAAALGQDFVMRAPLVMVLAANYARTTGRYGKRGIRYVDMEAGHAGENVHLQAEALGLGACMVGAFDTSAVAAALHLPAKYEPLYIMPVGHPR